MSVGYELKGCINLCGEKIVRHPLKAPRHLNTKFHGIDFRLSVTTVNI